MEETKFIVDYNDGASLEILGDNVNTYTVKFFDTKNNELVHQTDIKCNHWTRTSRKYYTDWKIIVYLNNIEVFSDTFNCEGKNVVVHISTIAMGDNISAVPYLEEFRKKHSCNLIVHSKFSWLFKKYYKNIIWEDIDTNNTFKPYTTYYISLGIRDFEEGIYKLNQYHRQNKPIKFIDGLTFYDKSFHPEHPLYIPLQKMTSNLLGLSFKELRPNFDISSERPIKEKYICFSEYASGDKVGMKFWNNQIGWKTIIEELKNRGYIMVSVSKEKCDFKNVIKVNNRPLEEVMVYLRYSEFFIGLGSGLSWLNWALGKKTVMINGFTEDWYEFQEDCIRVKNYDVCTGCFNSKAHADKLVCYHNSFCPENKNFECSRKISPKMVMNKIIENNLI